MREDTAILVVIPFDTFLFGFIGFQGKKYRCRFSPCDAKPWG
jgi:predicted glycosyl hydrolase (DUF1957 family)